MPQPYGSDNMQIWNSKDFSALSKLAALEHGGDGILYFRQYGESGTLSAGVEEEYWPAGGTRTRLTAAETMDVVSSSVQDSIGGTGVSFVQIKGVDADYNLVTEVVVLTGTTPVTTTNSFFSIYQMVGIPGLASGKNNAGLITATSSSTSAEQCRILATVGVSQVSHFTVPAGYTGFITQIILSMYRVSGTSPEYGEAIFRQGIHAIGAEVSPVRSSVSSIVPNIYDKPMPLVVAQKDELWLTGISDKNGARMAVQYDIVLLKGCYDQQSLIL